MYSDKFRLDNKVAIITGASRGIGESCAEAFMEAGAKLVLAGRKLDTLEEVAHRLYKAGGDATPIRAHVGKTVDCEDLVTRAAARYGSIDILVNNAGTNPHFGATLECPDQLWEKSFEVNLNGAFHMSRLCVPHMRERGAGVIVNNASYGGVKPIPGIGVYCVAKAALLMFTKVLAMELSGDNIRVNAVAPGIVNTKFSEAIWRDELKMAELKKHVPMKRMAEPDEVAAAILYLACDASGYSTGTVLSVDGGSSL